jgi:hypothetical protein
LEHLHITLAAVAEVVIALAEQVEMAVEERVVVQLLVQMELPEQVAVEEEVIGLTQIILLAATAAQVS